MRPLSNIQNESPKKHPRYGKASIETETTYNYNDEPVGKVFTDKKFSNPLHNLLVKNRQTLSSIRIEIPREGLSNVKQPCIKSKVDFPIFEDVQKSSAAITSKTMSSAQEHNSSSRKHEEATDNLACHANNILRMAIDSTMMSSMNSITLQNINSDSFDENIYTKEREDNATFGINEEEIRAAING
ncbi:hypothetical protein CANMA_000546 [Candida margitis]|uniref:uncharacterized protein n=1 Tax=Candida margitis TaxID=1775924 RepID=UPI002226DA37|nr:uncharacterized protein CANMA_000546 [Candida margitis]KAI5970383.1 hypothetical protein CANMA_000546 [Candida margitis]